MFMYPQNKMVQSTITDGRDQHSIVGVLDIIENVKGWHKTQEINLLLVL